MRRFGLSLVALSVAGVGSAWAAVPKDLPYPSGTPSADEIAAQVYFVNHFYALKNFSIIEDGDAITVLINRTKGDSPNTITVERHLNNNYSDGVIQAKDLAIFKSGKLRGTGLLVTDFVDDAKSQTNEIWLPALRKVRRFAQPAHDDAWGGSEFTYGDVTLRKPLHETHELLGKETFNECLGAMEVQDSEKNKYMQNLPGPYCDVKGKEVYKLKSTTKYQNWWYDYRISYVDTKHFADYRTEYFKDGQKVKVIDRAWGKLADVSDPRAMYWKYWYGQNVNTGNETWAVIPDQVVKYNRDLPDDLWTEATLRKIQR